MTKILFLILLFISLSFGEDNLDCNPKMQIYSRIDCYEKLNHKLEKKLKKLDIKSFNQIKEKCNLLHKNDTESYQGSGVFQLEKAICFNKEYNTKILSFKERKEQINIKKICNTIKNKKLLSEKNFSKITKIMQNETEKFYELVQCGLQVDAFVDIRSSPSFLRQAILLKKYKVIQFLLDNGANIERVDGDNNTPLLVAILFDDKKAIQILLKNKANILVKNNEGITAKKMLINKGYINNVSIPLFSDYPLKTTYNALNKPLLQKNFGRLYRTRLKKALKEKKPEFAGKYIIAQWGCDEGKDECTTGGIIDASTGKATEFPFKYYAHNGSKEIIYKLNSSLIVFAGDFEFKDGGTEDNKVLFYEFKDGKFLFLKASKYNKDRNDRN